MQLVLLLILCSCALNSSQEKALNQALSEYIYARNEGVIMTYTAYSAPEVIAYYKSIGDTAFIRKFSDSESNRKVVYQDGIIQTLQKEKQKIHVKYSFQRQVNTDDGVSMSKVTLFALSNDEGKSWFFMDEVDYLNDEIVPLTQRLIH